MRTTTTRTRGVGRQMQHRVLTTLAAGLALCLGTLIAEDTASAQGFTLQVEPAAAFWVDGPQSERFTPGFYGAVRPGISLGSGIVGFQWSYSTLLTPAKDDYTEDGSAHSLMAGMRIRPFASLSPPANQLGGLFMDFNIGYVRTGELDRVGYDSGVGYNFQVAPSFALGPVARYGQIIQPNHLTARDENDAQFVTLGLNFSFGPKHKDKEELVCPDCPTCPECAPVAKAPVEAAEDPEKCADFDRDGVCDADDQCPDRIGPPATLGCPIEPCGGDKLTVLVQFSQDSSRMPTLKPNDPQTMDPVLDEIATAIDRTPSCRVCITGYASEEGTHDYNQTLSLERAKAVQEYLTARGLEADRLPTAGMGERCQLVPKSTHVLNRRVEFQRLDQGESCSTECQE